MSTAPTSSARSFWGNRFWFHGAESITRSVRANGVLTGSSAERNAMRSSIFQAPTWRASSSTTPARVTAGSGSSRNAPRFADGHRVTARRDERVPARQEGGPRAGRREGR